MMIDSDDELLEFTPIPAWPRPSEPEVLPSNRWIKHRPARAEKSYRYQRLREVSNISGFVANIHDATNFDIDLSIAPHLHEKYRDVISNQYTYQEFGSEFLTHPLLDHLPLAPIEIGTTYRCRLRGVGLNQLPYTDHTWKSNQLYIEVIQLLDRTDGWITCNLSDIDVYRRLLVDITITTSTETIDLRDYLLAKMATDPQPLFYPYANRLPH